MKRQYTKPPLTFENQADLLIERGLEAHKAILISRLQSVNYYRLTAYLFPFRNSKADDRFREGTTFDEVWNRYTFDRQLRLLAMDAIERVEIAVRTQTVYHLVHRFGAFAHLDPKAFPDISPQEREKFLNELRNSVSKAQEAFIDHFRENYTGFPDLPLWVATEVMTFGSLLTMVRYCGKRAQRAIAGTFGVEGIVLVSWLRSLHYIRNVCAHHSRLWNRELSVRPLIPYLRKDARWHAGAHIKPERMFSVLTVLNYLMEHIAPQSGWRHRLFNLFDRYPNVPLRDLGIPTDWREHPLWQRTGDNN